MQSCQLRHRSCEALLPPADVGGQSADEASLRLGAGAAQQPHIEAVLQGRQRVGLGGIQLNRLLQGEHSSQLELRLRRHLDLRRPKGPSRSLGAGAEEPTRGELLVALRSVLLALLGVRIQLLLLLLLLQLLLGLALLPGGSLLGLLSLQLGGLLLALLLGSPCPTLRNSLLALRPLLRCASLAVSWNTVSP